MCVESSGKAKHIFLAAIEIKTPEDRREFLGKACDNDESLRRRVEALLIAHERPESLLDRGPVERAVPPTVEGPAFGERPGALIGPYKLREQIGEGGMGIVFVAEQEKPLRRKVALKVIKPGMDTKAVIVRFEAERQALALMDHPNIAKVLDAGTTENGHPYFVMELVRGVEITRYCDEHKLTVHERLELFMGVCQAIQHAHQKGIIHRDVKPSNVLVTEQDGKAVPKVIDFGVAKAIGQSLSDRTIYTSFQAVIGTPLYMSPEQAALSNFDVDTRSDVYSLGVLLYELLTGTTPFDKETLKNAAQDEVLRMIREEEPPKPSTKISTLGERAANVSRVRQTDVARLGKTVRGDLDWIVMRALAKERARRYQTASDIEADIRRFLIGDAIEARPPSSLYRLRKTIARHRLAFVATSAVMLSLLTGLLFSLHFQNQATATLLRLHNHLVEKAILAALAGDEDEAKSAITLAEDAGVPKTTLKTIKGIAYYHCGDNKNAKSLLEAVRDEEPQNMLARAMLAITYVHAGEWNRYVQEMSCIEQSREAVAYQDHESLILGYALLYYDTARSLKILEDTVHKHPSWLVAHSLLGAAKSHLALEELDFAKARQLSKEGLGETRIAFDLLRDNRVAALYYLWARHAAIYLAQQDGTPLDELRDEAEAAVRVLKNSCADYTAGAFNIAIYYLTIDKPEAAIEVFSTALDNTTPNNWTYHYAAFLVQQGRHAEALQIFDATPSDNTNAMLAKSFLTVADPARRDDVREVSQTLISERELLDAGPDAVHLLCLLGDQQTAKAKSKGILEVLTDGREGSTSAKWLPNTCLRFHAGEIDVEEFDDACSHNQVERLVFHYCVAMQALSVHDRTTARRHFEECAASSQLDWGPRHWAKAFLRLMQDNPNWPEPEAER